MKGTGLRMTPKGGLVFEDETKISTNQKPAV